MKLKLTAGAAALALSTAFAAPVQAAERVIFNCFFRPSITSAPKYCPS